MGSSCLSDSPLWPQVLRATSCVLWILMAGFRKIENEMGALSWLVRGDAFDKFGVHQLATIEFPRYQRSSRTIAVRSLRRYQFYHIQHIHITRTTLPLPNVLLPALLPPNKHTHTHMSLISSHPRKPNHKPQRITLKRGHLSPMPTRIKPLVVADGITLETVGSELTGVCI